VSLGLGRGREAIRRKKESVSEGTSEAHSRIVQHFANIVIELMGEGFSKELAMKEAYVPIDLKPAVSARVDEIRSEEGKDRYP